MLGSLSSLLAHKRGDSRKLGSEKAEKVLEKKGEVKVILVPIIL
jgi:hypothetical protein